MDPLRVDVPGGDVLHRLGGAATFRVDQELGVGVLGAGARDVVGPDPGMDVALPVPDVETRGRSSIVPRPVARATKAPSHMSGPNSISVSAPCSAQMCSTTLTAFEEVQQ